MADAELPAALAIGLCAGILPLAVPGLALWAVVAGVCFLPIVWRGFCKPKQWTLLFCAAAILLPPLPLPVGDSGAHLSIVIAAAGLLAGAARLSEWRIEWNALNAALAALLGAFAISLGFAVLYSGFALGAASGARFALFACGVFVYFTASQGPGAVDRPQAQRCARWLFPIAAAAALFGCIDFIYQLPAPAGFGAQFIWLNSGMYRRAQGLFYDASALGNFCAFFLIMSVAALVHRERGKKILPAAVASAGGVLFLIALLLSFSRAPLLAAGIGCVTLAILERSRSKDKPPKPLPSAAALPAVSEPGADFTPRPWWSRRPAGSPAPGGPAEPRPEEAVRSRGPSPRLLLALAALAPVAVAIFAVALPEFAQGYWARAGFDWNSLLTSPDAVLSGRLESWRTIGGFIEEHTWQTAAGIGYKTLPYTRHFGKPVIADNMYLSSLVETGVLGLCSLLAVNAAILRVCFRAARRGSFFGKWMFCFWAGEMFQMFAGDILTFWRVLPVYFWVLAQAAREAGEP